MPQISIRDQGCWIPFPEHPMPTADLSTTTASAVSISETTTLSEEAIAEINEDYAEDLAQILSDGITYAYDPDADDSDDGYNGVTINIGNIRYPSEADLRRFYAQQSERLGSIRTEREVDAGLKAIALKYENTNLNY